VGGGVEKGNDKEEEKIKKKEVEGGGLDVLMTYLTKKVRKMNKKVNIAFIFLERFVFFFVKYNVVLVAYSLFTMTREFFFCNF